MPIAAVRGWESRIGRRLKLRDLHILSVVVQWGSMAKAASRLAMSQPAVSESVANLESALGVRLLDRTPRGVEPTLYAHALLKRGHAVFDELLQGVRDIEFLANPNVGEIRIAAGDTAAACLLGPVIDALSRRYPDVAFRFIQSSAEQLQFPEIRERAADVAITRISRSFTQGELDVEFLFDDPARVVVGANSPWARKRKVSLEDLVDAPWTLTADQVIRELVSEAFVARGLQPPREKVTASSMLLRSRLLATGRYVTVLPQSVLRGHALGPLKALPVDLRTRPMAVALVTLRNRTISPVVQLFLAEVRAVAKRHALMRGP